MHVGTRTLLAGALLVGLCACSSGDEPAVRDTAAAFQRAVAQDDGPAACALLSDEARTRLEASSGRTCPAALTALALTPDEVGAVQVWGGEAQVRLGGEALFLAELRAGWRVTGAGCTPRGERPYDCRVRA